ncbi:MAG: Uncharacterized protein CEN89_347 [Candidatus Berkelbacteria bacterium Licking1014_7]|uniref:Hydrogenase expression/formation protein HypC n=1 Tax=Candidatus Berkelbacteria bacterium Licking1014_7 TaxID=2017147 RepID=A0A554LJE2_9BACT|nr:MAG: Uncharacterized protein CEN89_347 [Candidatus Berkelbacteria bacterium Licking1014_7]
MCLATPMKIIGFRGEKAQVQGENHSHLVDVSLLPKLKKGDWLIAHGDIAIQILDKKSADEMLKLSRELSPIY